MAIKVRHDVLPVRTNVVSNEITRSSRLVSAITGFQVQPNKAIVGANAFAHESGIHQDGMIKDASTYEIMTPESVGLTTSNLVMGKHSGRAAFKQAEELGYSLGDNAFQDAFAASRTCRREEERLDEDSSRCRRRGASRSRSHQVKEWRSIAARRAAARGASPRGRRARNDTTAGATARSTRSSRRSASSSRMRPPGSSATRSSGDRRTVPMPRPRSQCFCPRTDAHRGRGAHQDTRWRARAPM